MAYDVDATETLALDDTGRIDLIGTLTISDTVTVLLPLVVNASETLALSDTLTPERLPRWWEVAAITVTKGSVAEPAAYWDQLLITTTADAEHLILTEVAGVGPAFDYTFTFEGVPTDEATHPHAVRLIGRYDSNNPTHSVVLYQWNYDASQWYPLTGTEKDLPAATTDSTYHFPIQTDGFWISSGQLKLQIYHTSNGTAGHQLFIDQLILETDLAVNAGETLALSDGPASGTLDPLQAAPVGETLALTETSSATLDPLQAAPTAETLALSETVTVEIPLEVALSETLALSASGRIDFIGTLTISDADLTVAGDDLTIALDPETLALTATASALLDPLQAAATDETLTLSETATSVLEPLQATPTDETLTLSDGPAVVESDILFASLTEELTLTTGGFTRRSGALVLTDTATSFLDPLQASPTDETLALSDGPAVGILDLGVSTTETLALTATAAGTLDPLQAAPTAETLALSDADLTVTRIEPPLIAEPDAETLALTDTATGTLFPLQVALTTETVTLTTVATMTLDPLEGALTVEDVFVRDTATLAPTFADVSTIQASALALTVSMPSFTVGDLLLLLVETANQEPTITTPATGWTRLGHYGLGTPGSTGAVGLTVWWKYAELEDVNPVLADAGDHQSGCIIALHGWGWAKELGLHVSGTLSTPASVFNHSWGGVTTTLPRCYVLYALARDTRIATAEFGTTGANAKLTGLTKLVDAGTEILGGGGIMVWGGTLEVEGPTGTLTASSLSSCVAAGVCLTIRPGQVLFDVEEDPLSPLPLEETFALSDSVEGTWLRPLQAAPADETLALTETAVGTLDPLRVVLTAETLALSASAAGTLDPLETAPTAETLALTDGPPVIERGILSASLTEELTLTASGRIDFIGTLVLTDTAEGTLDPLQTVLADDTLVLTDGPAQGRVGSYDVDVPETLALTDGPVVADMGVISADLAETLALTSGGWIRRLGSLQITDDDLTATVLDDLYVSRTETLALSDTVTAQYAPSSLRIYEVLFATGLIVDVAETLALTDPGTRTLDPLETALTTETLALRDTTPALSGLAWRQIHTASVVIGSTVTETFTATQLADGVSWTLADTPAGDSPSISTEWIFHHIPPPPAGGLGTLCGVPMAVEIRGAYSGAVGDTVLVYQWSFSGEDWVRLTAATTDLPINATTTTVFLPLLGNQDIDPESLPYYYSGPSSGGDGEIRIKFVVDGPGNAAHRLTLDYVQLVDRYAPLAGEPLTLTSLWYVTRTNSLERAITPETLTLTEGGHYRTDWLENTQLNVRDMPVIATGLGDYDRVVPAETLALTDGPALVARDEGITTPLDCHLPDETLTLTKFRNQIRVDTYAVDASETLALDDAGRIDLIGTLGVRDGTEAPDFSVTRVDSGLVLYASPGAETLALSTTKDVQLEGLHATVSEALTLLAGGWIERVQDEGVVSVDVDPLVAQGWLVPNPTSVETLALSTTLRLVMQIAWEATETLALSDPITLSLPLVVNATDTLALTDGPVIGEFPELLERNLPDETLALTDTVSTGLELLVAVADETLTLTTVADSVIGDTVSLSETLALSDPAPTLLRGPEWWEVSLLELGFGAIVSGTLPDTYTSNGLDLRLSEQAATPGFAYHFIFTHVPVSTAVGLYFFGRYAGGDPERILVSQWNYSESRWDRLTAATDDIPATPGVVARSWALRGNADLDPEALPYYYWGAATGGLGQMRFRVEHVEAGDALHELWIDQLVLLTGVGLSRAVTAERLTLTDGPPVGAPPFDPATIPTDDQSTWVVPAQQVEWEVESSLEWDVPAQQVEWEVED